MSKQDDNADGISQIIKSSVHCINNGSSKEYEQKSTILPNFENLEGISDIQNSCSSIHLKKENLQEKSKILNVMEQINDLQKLVKEEKETSSSQNKKKSLPKKNSPAKNKSRTPKKSQKTPTKVKIPFESPKKRHNSDNISTEAIAIKRPKIQENVDDEKEEVGDEDGWQDVADCDDSNMNVDEALEEKAVKIKMTAKNVKSVIHHVLTNEHVRTMFKTVLESEKGEKSPQKPGTPKKIITTEKLDCVPKMTRAKVKDFLEKICVPSPVKNMKDGPSILDLEFAEEEDDDEYNPEKDEECHDSDDDESISSSRLSEIGSPYAAATPTTPVIRNVRDDSISTTPIHHSCSTISNSGTPRNLVDAFTASAGPSEEEKQEGDDNIALRTRSKLPLTSTSIIEIESKFVAPDITPDMYDVSCEDSDWLQFLSSLYKTSDETITDDDGDPNDPEFNYIAEAEREKLDKEDFRCDKPTKITKKELNILINELNGLFEDELLPYQVVASVPEVNFQMPHQNRHEGDYHDLQSTSSTSFTDFKTPQAPTSQHHLTSSISYDTNQCLNNIQSSNGDIRQDQMQYEGQGCVASSALPEESSNNLLTSEQLVITQDNMRKHIQLLAQSFLLFHNTAGELSNLPYNMILELANFRDNSPAQLNSVYNVWNLDPAIDLGKDDSIFENIGSSDAMLTTTQKKAIYNSPVFIYPSLLPHFRIKPNETKKCNKFLDSEDNLIALGLEQFQYCRNVLPVQLIKDLLIRGKSTNQIHFRIKFKSSAKTGDNPIKHVKKTGKLPINFPKPSVDQYFPMAPKDQNHDNLPAWCMDFKSSSLSNNLQNQKMQICKSSTAKHKLQVTIPAQSQHTEYISPNMSLTKARKTTTGNKKRSFTPAPVLPSDNRFQTLILPSTLAPVSSIFIQFAPSPGYTPLLQQTSPALPVLTCNVARSAVSDVSTNCSVTIDNTTLSTISQTSLSTQTDAATQFSSTDQVKDKTQVPSSPDMLAKSMIACGIEASPICPSPSSPTLQVCDVTNEMEPCAMSTSTPASSSLKHPIVRNLRSAFDAAHSSTVQVDPDMTASDSVLAPKTVGQTQLRGDDEEDDKTENLSSQSHGKKTAEFSERMTSDQMSVSDEMRTSGSSEDVSEDTYRLHYSESDRDSTLVTDDDDDLMQSMTKSSKVLMSHEVSENLGLIDNTNNGHLVISNNGHLVISNNGLEKEKSHDNEMTSISQNVVLFKDIATTESTAANVEPNSIHKCLNEQPSLQGIEKGSHVSSISPNSTKNCSKRRLIQTCPSNPAAHSPKGVTLWEQSNSPARHSDTSRSPQKLRPLAPKPETPSKLSSPGYIPLPKVSPRRKELNKQVRNLLPKSFIFEAKTPSPTKSAALLLKKKATLVCQQRSPVKILPKAPQPIVSPSKPRPRVTLTPSRMYTRSQHVKTKNAAQKVNQEELKKKNAVAKKDRSNEVELEEANLSQEDEEEDDEVFGDDDQMQLEDLMAACTTIGYEPKKGGTQDTDTKSKSQKKKDLCLAMLEPDIIERDPKKDERDTAYAQYYFNRVKEVLKDDPERFRKFLTHLHDLNKDHCNPVELYADMAVLLSDHQDLVDDFGGFLLSFQAVECQCFVSNLEYQQIRSFLRQLEIYCDNSTFTYQRTLKMMSKWLSLNQDAQTDCTPFRDRISAVLRHVPGLMDDLLSYFFDAPLPDSHPDDFENVELDEFFDLSETDKFEEVTLPEGREDYNTKLCSCKCHADQQDEKLQKRSRHCISCSLKMFDGRPVLKMCRNEYHDVSVVYPLEEKEKLAKAKKEAAQIALAKARAQRQQKKKNKKKKSLGKLKPKNSRKRKKIKRSNSTKLGNNQGKSSTQKDIATEGILESKAQCSSLTKIDRDIEVQAIKECAIRSQSLECSSSVVNKEEVKLKTDQPEPMLDPRTSVSKRDSSPNLGHLSASAQPSSGANLKMPQSPVKSLQLTSNSTERSEFSCKSPPAMTSSSNLSPKCGSPASTAVVTGQKASRSEGPAPDLSHVTYPKGLAQPVIFNVANSFPQARFMRCATPTVTPSIRAQQPGHIFSSPSIIGARIPVMITLQPQMSLSPSCQPSSEPTDSQKSKSNKSSKSPTRRKLPKKNPEEKTARKNKEKISDAKDKSKQKTKLSSQSEVLKNCSSDASTKTNDANSDNTKKSLGVNTQHCVDVTQTCPVSCSSVPAVIVTSSTAPTKDGKEAHLMPGLEDNNSCLTALSRNPSLMNDLQTSDTCSLFHFSPSKFKGKIPDIVRAHLDNFSLGGFDESMDIHVQQLAQTLSPSKLGDSTSKFDLLAFLDSSNLAMKETSCLSSGNIADTETRLSFSGAISEMNSPASGPNVASSGQLQSQIITVPVSDTHFEKSISVDPVKKSRGLVTTEVKANLSQAKLAVKEANDNELKVIRPSSTSNVVDSTQVDDVEEWTEEWDRSILNVVAVEGIKDPSIRKIQEEIPGKSADEIQSRARLLLQMLQNMGEGDSDTGTEMSCDDSSNMG